MTRRDYRKAKRKNREAYLRIQRKSNGLIRASYLKSITGFKAIVSRLPTALLSGSNRTLLEGSIDRAGLFDEQVKIIKDAGLEAMRVGSKVDIEYLAEKFEKAGVEISKEQLEAMYERDHGLLLAQYQISNSFIPLSRKVQEASFLLQNRANYTLSKSIWDGIDSYSDKVIAYVQGSLEAGIDPVKIARDLERYLREGSNFVIGQWGELVPGTSRYRKRIGKAGADYRTQRVVRTELYQMIRDNEIHNATLNPGTIGMFLWVLSPGHIDWGCECPQLAGGGPYTELEVQQYSDSIHPNCQCVVEAELKSDEDFMKELEEYVQGKDTPGARGMEQWAERYGLTN
jgi:hypothetical protein